LFYQLLFRTRVDRIHHPILILALSQQKVAFLAIKTKRTLKDTLEEAETHQLLSAVLA
jgi:hypothetical protein